MPLEIAPYRIPTQSATAPCCTWAFICMRGPGSSVDIGIMHRGRSGLKDERENSQRNPISDGGNGLKVSFSNRTISHVDIVITVAKRSGFPVMAPSPQNSSGPRIAITASFPRLETTFDLAPVDVENGIRGVSLRVKDLIFWVSRYIQSLGVLAKKRHDVQWRRFCAWLHCQLPLPTGN